MTYARIGVDFDNTIAGFDGVFAETAARSGLVAPDFRGSKRALRDAIRRLPDGELAWQRLQGQVYGAGMASARIIDGADEFLRRCRAEGHDVFLVSHKTEHGHHDPGGINLRTVALEWMTAHRFFEPSGCGLDRSQVYFEDTRRGKLERIASLGCTVFIDDLEEVLLDPDFPPGITRIHFTDSRVSARPDLVQCRTWPEIARIVLAAPSRNGDEQAARLAAACLGVTRESLDAVTRIATRGGNSGIYRIERRGEVFALKRYPAYHRDGTGRLDRETAAIRLMERHQIASVPTLVCVERTLGCLLLRWIEGTAPDNPTEHDIDAAARFLSAVHDLRHDPAAHEFAFAAEACLSAAETERQIRSRLERLNEQRASERGLAAFLDRAFAPLLADVVSFVRAGSSEIGLGYDAPLSRECQSLIPADFGFHNSVRQTDGTLVFVDFEYFGWDDPVRLTADFLLHPGMTLTRDVRERFRAAAERRHAADPHFTARLDLLYTLFGLRWVLILLNAFLPERWVARQHAAGLSDWPATKTRQLERAEKLLDRLARMRRNGVSCIEC